MGQPTFKIGTEGPSVSYTPQLETDYKQSQVDLNKKLIEQMSGGGGDLIYRDPATGVEIPQQQALSDISQGKQYTITRRNITRQGVKEDIVSKPEPLTDTEKTYAITSKRILGAVDDLEKVVYPDLIGRGVNMDWASLQAQKVPYPFIKDKMVKRFRQNLAQLKADIPFLRGGKQLTVTEAARVDILLNPFGKDAEARARDLASFRNEFTSGAELMLGGRRTLPQQQGQSQGQKTGGQIMVDAQGNKAMVYPDGTFEEVQ